MGLHTIKLISFSCSVNLMTFAAGNAVSWSSVALLALKSDDIERNPIGRPITYFEESWIVSLISLGAAAGCPLSGYMSHRIGRKHTLLTFALPMLMAQIILAFATSPVPYYLARFMSGLGLGCSLTVIPMYVAEIAKTEIRGFLGCIVGILISSGNLFAYIVGPHVHLKTFSFILMIPILLFFFTFGLFSPESPYYHIIVGDEPAAEKCLKKLRKEKHRHKELTVIKETVEESLEQKISISGLWHSKSFRKGIIITTALMVFQQFTGIMVVLSYMDSIFIATGSSLSSSVSTVIVSTIQTLTIVLTSSLIDVWGRRRLLSIATVGTTISLFIMGLFFYLKHIGYDVSPFWWTPLFSLVLYIISYKAGLGSIPWALTGELFSPKTKSLATTMVSTTCLVLAFVMTLIFPILSKLLGMHGVFWIFSAFGLLSFLFVVWYVPETKGKTFQEILKMLEE